MAKVLVFGDDTGSCLAIIRSLGRRGIEVHLANSDRNEATSRSRYLAAMHELPRYRDDGSAWVAAVRALVARHGFALLVPTSDSSLAQLLRHERELDGARTAVPNVAAAETFCDKWATRLLAAQLGVPVPRGRLIDPDSEAAELAREVALPAVLKSRRSYQCGGREQKTPVRLVGDEADLARELAAERFELVEDYVPGFCRGLSVIASGGRILAAHQHRRLRQEHSTGPSSSRVSEPCDPQLLEWTQRMAAATRLTGVAMFEYRHSPATGATVLLEVNPRFWGSLPLALAAGADFPALLYGLLVEGRKAPPAFGSRAGVRKRNLLGEQRAFSAALEQAHSPLGWLRLILRGGETLALLVVSGHRFDSWAADDPAPFRAERQQLLRDAAHYLGKRRRSAWRRMAAPAQ